MGLVLVAAAFAARVVGHAAPADIPQEVTFARDIAPDPAAKLPELPST
jgi:hypothetical protein